MSGGVRAPGRPMVPPSGTSPPSRQPMRGPIGPPPQDRRLLETAVVVVGGVGVIGFVWTMLAGNYDQYAAVLIAMVLLAATVPLARHAARIEGRPALAWMLMGVVILKLLGAVARYVVAYGVYGGVADASTYTTVALENYHAFRHLHLFSPDTGVFHGLVPFIDTVIYAIAGPTELGAFLVFSWISFIGLYLFYRAFRIAYPEGAGRRYALLVFLLPSLLYWPSSLGKEGWMVFALGLASYGLARALTGRFGGYLAMVAGIGAMLLVRPHLALIFLPAAIIAFLLRRSTPGKRRPVGRLIGIVVLVLSSLIVVAKAQSYFGITNLDVQTVTQELNTTKTQTAIGNSAFTPPNAQSPLGYPEAVVTVLFRPFPFEAHSVTVLISSGEGLVLLLVTLGSWRRLRRLPQALWRNPFVVFSLVYSALFVLAFANFANFGILARERVQMFPMFLVLLAVPAVAEGPIAATKRKAARRLPGRRTVALLAGTRGAGTREAGPPLTGARLTGARRAGAPLGRRRPTPILATGTAASARPAPVTAASARRLGPYVGLGYRFDVVADRGTPAPAVEKVLAGLAAPASASAAAPADHHFHLGLVDGKDGPLISVGLDGETVRQSAAEDDALVTLMTAVNVGAVASRPDHLVVHAAAVSWEGRGLLLPGPPGAGKTTLAAGLVAAGFDYLTDEAAAIDPLVLGVDPYPKPLSVGPGSFEALRHLLADPGPTTTQTRLVPADDLRPAAIGVRVPPRFLVFPTYQQDADTVLKPIPRAEALVELANNSFNFVHHGGAWLDLLAQVVRGCACHTLTVGDLDRACELLGQLVGAEEGSAARGR